MTFSNSEKYLWSNVLIPFSLFILLSPGAFITFPRNSSKRCSDLIPLPTKYTFEKGDGEGMSELQNVNSEILNGPAMKPIHLARQKCTSMYGSFSSSIIQISIHALIFTFICIVFRQFLNN